MATTKFGCHSSKLTPTRSTTTTSSHPHRLATTWLVSIATASTPQPPLPSNPSTIPPGPRNTLVKSLLSRTTWLPRKQLPGTPCTSNRTPSTSSATRCQGSTWDCPRKSRFPRRIVLWLPTRTTRNKKSSLGLQSRPNPPRQLLPGASRSRLPSNRLVKEGCCQGSPRRLSLPLLVGATRLLLRRKTGEIKISESFPGLFVNKLFICF